MIVPHVVSKEGAQRAVDAAKYAPEGHRGSCLYISAAEFSLFEWGEYQEWANRETMLFVLVEDKEGVQNIDEILSVKGIDAVFLGPFDMSVGMGLRGNTTHPEVQESLGKVLAACRTRNIPAMHALLYPTDIDKLIESGVRMFAHGSDTAVLAQGSVAFLRSVEGFRIQRAQAQSREQSPM